MACNKRRKLPQNMSDPIHYIDLTVDSPTDKPLKLRNKNIENISNNNTATKSRKRNSTKRQLSQLQDSILEISVENTCKGAQAMEIIDLDNTMPEQTRMCYVNNSNQKNLVVLTCPICYEQLSSEIKPMSTPCGHIFCTQCLKLALRKAKRCPTCQKNIKLQSCNRLYF